MESGQDEFKGTITAYSANYHAHHDPWPGNVDLVWLRQHSAK
jgi:hypothetical protein